MAHSPLDQFLITKLFPINVYGLDLSFTNSSFAMFTCVALVSFFFIVSMRDVQLVPTRLQMAGEMVYIFINEMLEGSAGPESRKFLPFILSMFLLILFGNLLGMMPFGFTFTSHFAANIALACLTFCTVTIYGFYKHGIKFLTLFAPSGVPFILLPLIILIELFTFLIRPLSLCIRLSANMIAGHILLKILAGFVVSMAFYLKWLPIPLIMVIIAFEIFVAVLQAYIFAILSCVYLNDAVNLH